LKAVLVARRHTARRSPIPLLGILRAQRGNKKQNPWPAARARLVQQRVVQQVRLEARAEQPPQRVQLRAPRARADHQRVAVAQLHTRLARVPVLRRGGKPVLGGGRQADGAYQESSASLGSQSILLRALRAAARHCHAASCAAPHLSPFVGI